MCILVTQEKMYTQLFNENCLNSFLLHVFCRAQLEAVNLPQGRTAWSLPDSDTTFFQISFTPIFSSSLDQPTSKRPWLKASSSLFPPLSGESLVGVLRPWRCLQPMSFTGRTWHDCLVAASTTLYLRWGGRCTCWGAAMLQEGHAPAWSSTLLRYQANTIWALCRRFPF